MLLSTESVKAAIFDTFHCVHCGSVSPPEWISARKGTKTPFALPVSGEAVAFLSSELLVKVGPPGPSKAVSKLQAILQLLVILSFPREIACVSSAGPEAL